MYYAQILNQRVLSMNLQYFHEYFKDLTSGEVEQTKQAFFGNIRRSFFPIDKAAFLSTLTSVIALIGLTVAAALGIAIGVVCLAFALLTGGGPGARKEFGFNSESNFSQGSSKSGIFVIGLIVGFAVGFPSLLGAVIQVVSLPFQLIVLPFVLIGAALKACIGSSKNENLKKNSVTGKPGDGMQTTASLDKSLRLQRKSSAGQNEYADTANNDTRSQQNSQSNNATLRYSGTQFTAPTASSGNDKMTASLVSMQAAGMS